MNKQSVSALLLFVLVFSSAYPDTPVIYISEDGSGDQQEINRALDFVADNPDYTTVYLKGPNTYLIDNSVFVSGDTILEGNSTAVVKLADNAGW